MVNSGNGLEEKTVKLGRSIDLQGSEENQWIPIGTSENPFKCTFEGQDNTISGIYINDSVSAYQGLFGYIDGATIKNLAVEGYIKGGKYVGGIAGRNAGTIENCYNTGTITGSVNFVGGIAGFNKETIENCYNTGTVEGSDNKVGGIAGASDGIIENCYNTGTVTGNNDVGGIAGASGLVTISNCYNTGTVSGEVTGSGEHIGGIVGTGGSPVQSRRQRISSCFYR